MKKKFIILTAALTALFGSTVGAFASTSDTLNANQVCTGNITNEENSEKLITESSPEITESNQIIPDKAIISEVESYNNYDDEGQSGESERSQSEQTQSDIEQSSSESDNDEALTQYVDENQNKYLIYSDGEHYTGWYEMQPYGELYYDPENNGAAVTGCIREIDKKSYLFDSNGIAIKTFGTPLIDENKYWVKSDGSLGTGWLILGKWKLYFDPETYIARTVADGVTDIEGKSYLFNKDGIVQNFAGTTVIDGAKYWFSEDDASLKAGWLTLGSWKLYFDSETYEGAVGITNIDGKKYLFDSNGILKTSGTPSIDGKKYYIGADNTLQSGWQELGSRRMYIDPDTYEAVTGIKVIDGKKFIFDKNGLLVEGSGTFIVDGNKYAIDGNGNAITGWISLEDGKCILIRKQALLQSEL